MNYIHNFNQYQYQYYNRSFLEKSGEEYDEFFTDTALGDKGKSYKDYIEFYNNLTLDNLSEIFNIHDKGAFSDHISKSIPGHKEVQKMTAYGVSKILKSKKNPIVLDIGGSDNLWSKTVTEFSNFKIKSVTIDPNSTMKEISEKISKVTGNEYKLRSFMDPYDDIQPLEEDDKFDCIHESMTFQFISAGRGSQIKYLKDKLLKKGGFVLLEEKLFNDNWEKFEKLKDEYKKHYFSEKEIIKKSKKILKNGMNKNLISERKMENILSKNFKFYQKYWDGGNFMGYIASDKKIKIDKFLTHVRIPSFINSLTSFFKRVKSY